MQVASNKSYLWAVLVILSIPVIMVGGGAAFNAIDPEKLAGHTNYVRNYGLIQMAKSALWLVLLGTIAAAWLLACSLVVRAKGRSYGWVALALLGPIGFVVLASLPDLGSESSDLYARFVRRLNVYVRIAYELAFLILAFNLAWELMLLQREAIILFQSFTTGLTRAQIIDQQNASSGMWAFGEFLEELYYLVLLYVLRPIGVNLVGALFERRRTSGKA
jgi:hypothetical protein